MFKDDPARKELWDVFLQSREEIKSLLSEEALGWYDWREPPSHVVAEIKAMKDTIMAERRERLDDRPWVVISRAYAAPRLSLEAMQWYGRHQVPSHVATELEVAKDLIKDELGKFLRQSRAL